MGGEGSGRYGKGLSRGREKEEEWSGHVGEWEDKGERRVETDW